MNRAGRMDALLLLMVVIWGSNYSVIKRAFEEVPPQAFNAMRITVAALVFLAAIAWSRRRGRQSAGVLSSVLYTPAALTLRDRWDLVWVGLVGHFAYQYCFVRGVAGTSASNAALIIGMTPIVVAILSAALGHERISRVHWIGVAVSILGVYFIVGRGASLRGAAVQGDLTVAVAMVCWAIYTLGSSRLMARHSPLYVTGMTMALGGLPYAALMFPQVSQVAWSRVSAFTLSAIVFSALLALCLSYLIWYAAVQRMGASRTAVYSNLVPISAMAVAVLWLHEPVSVAQLIGTGCVLTGVALTRFGRPARAIPIEE
jgi:drug/metabolite transporter (DMT)-like permease